MHRLHPGDLTNRKATRSEAELLPSVQFEPRRKRNPMAPGKLGSIQRLDFSQLVAHEVWPIEMSEPSITDYA
jgi:hypothetical protein